MAKIKKMDHIGIVVSNMQEAIDIYRKLLSREPIHREYIHASKVELVFFDVGDVQIELLTPTGPDSKIFSFLEERGEGLHHICYEVEGINEILVELKKKGIKLIDETPRSGSRSSKIAYVNPTSTRGVYIEYCEYTSFNSESKN